MRKSGVLLLAIFFAATLSLVYGDAALAQTGGFVKIGGEIIPVDLQPVYDQDGNIVSYAFTAESTNLSGVRGNIKFAPPLQGALGTPSPQVGQGTCIENVIYQMVFVNGGTDPTEFTLELLPHQPINIPGQTTVRVSHSLDGELTDATGDGITMTPAGSNVIEWFVGPPQTNLGVGLGPAASHPAQANPGLVRCTPIGAASKRIPAVRLALAKRNSRLFLQCRRSNIPPLADSQVRPAHP